MGYGGYDKFLVIKSLIPAAALLRTAQNFYRGNGLGAVKSLRIMNSAYLGVCAINTIQASIFGEHH